MKAMDIANALNDIDYDMIEEAEVPLNRKKRVFRKKKGALIAAALVLLLCGTVAASGLLWMKPDVQANKNSLDLQLNGAVVTLPESAVQEILAARDPERRNTSFLTFHSLEEWQKFFALPFVASDHLAVDESPKWVDYGTCALVPEGTIDTFVTTEDKDGGYELCLMTSTMHVEWYHNDTENFEFAWDGSITIHVPLNETAAKEGSSIRELNEDMEAEILMEYTTPSGIPCVISKIQSEYTDTLFLYYGYESVIYELEVMAASTEEEAMILKDLQEYAETIQILYPAVLFSESEKQS